MSDVKYRWVHYTRHYKRSQGQQARMGWSTSETGRAGHPEGGDKPVATPLYLPVGAYRVGVGARGCQGPLACS